MIFVESNRIHALLTPYRFGNWTKLMPLLQENRQRIRRPIPWARTPGVALAISLFVVSSVHLAAQLPKSAVPQPSNAGPAARVDQLDRRTPCSAMMGALKYGQRQDFATAAHYLQSDPSQGTDLVQIARELHALRPNFKGDIDFLSDEPEGIVESGLPPGEVRAGVLTVGSTTVDVILVRVNDPVSGKIWLISKETVANVPRLYAQKEREEPTAADRIAIVVQGGRQLLGMSVGQWLGWLLSIPISWLLAWLLAFLLSMPRRVWYKFRKLPFSTVWETPLGLPLRCIIAILIHVFFVYLLAPPLLYRTYYFRFIAALLAGCLAWLVSRITDRGFNQAVEYTHAHHRGGESILILMQRISRVVMLIIAFVAALALFGFNVKTALAGLGIGGLAIALGAQKTLENLIGGVSLLMDKAVQVGDFCKIGDRVGIVEDIGLRSLKLRTLDQNMLVVPNGLLATMQFENMRARSKLLISQNFSLRIETQVEQLRFVLDRVKSMLDSHPAIESGSRVRVTNFVGAAFQLELFAYGMTGNWTDFTAIRQDILLKIVEIVEAAGTGFAAPTQLTYLSRDTGIDKEKTNDIVRQVTELRTNNAFRFPGET
jgi:MscS family membrane protein